VIFDEVIFDEVIFDEAIFDEVIFDEVMILDEAIAIVSDVGFVVFADVVGYALPVSVHPPRRVDIQE